MTSGRVAGVAVALLLVAAACGDDDAGGGSTTSGVATSDPPVTEPTRTQLAEAEPDATSGSATTDAVEVSEEVEIIEVIGDIEWYAPCGNEPLRFDGEVWWPLLPEELDALDESRYPRPQPQGVAARVAPPGPGDDVGTLVVFSDGIARFESHSGAIVIWLGETERSYDWVC